MDGPWGTWTRNLAGMKTDQTLGTWTRCRNARRFLSGKRNPNFKKFDIQMFPYSNGRYSDPHCIWYSLRNRSITKTRLVQYSNSVKLFGCWIFVQDFCTKFERCSKQPNTSLEHGFHPKTTWLFIRYSDEKCIWEHQYTKIFGCRVLGSPLLGLLHTIQVVW